MDPQPLRSRINGRKCIGTHLGNLNTMKATAVKPWFPKHKQASNVDMLLYSGPACNCRLGH